MTFYFDARSAKWPSVRDAILSFNGWREQNSGYFYIKPNPALRREISTLCSHLDLNDAYSFADEDLADRPPVPWFDLAAQWQPPHN